MGTQQVFTGGSVNDLSPPPPVDEDGFGRFESIIRSVMTGVPNEEWSDEVRGAFDAACNFLQSCHRKGDNFALELERIHEPGAAGPGRSVRLKATYMDRKDGNPRTRLIHPRSFKLDDIVFVIRNFLEYNALV